MNNIKKKSAKEKIEKKWHKIDATKNLTTKEKLEKLVTLNLKRKVEKEKNDMVNSSEIRDQDNEPFAVKDFLYPLDSVFGKLALKEWQNISSGSLAILAREEEFSGIDPLKLLYFDTETTGLAGGAGTIPFMLGFGFFEEGNFRVRIYVLKDLYREEEFLNAIDDFLGKIEIAATVTYNGKSFDFPLMEGRYILLRKRFPLLKFPHFDFLFSARQIWKYTYESRTLGYLGETILGISRDEDIEGSQIPSLYFRYLRSNFFSLIEKVIEHNALDIVGLSALLLQAAKYVEDHDYISDDGELFGLAVLFEKYGELEKSEKLYRILKESATRSDILSQAVKRLSIILKKKKLFDEASELWEFLQKENDHFALRELSIHYEHRQRNYYKALEFVEKGVRKLELTETQRFEFEKRLKRLQKRIGNLEDQ